MSRKPALSTTVSVTAEPVEGSVVARVSGEIDRAAVSQLRQQLEEARDEARPTLLDLSDVTFVDSAGLRLLLELCREPSNGGPPFWIVRPSFPVRRLLEITGAREVLPILDEAP